ncbi:MAG: amidase [Planctomycetes bacterium]|nr:amidase [Planctomycetota bacterium]
MPQDTIREDVLFSSVRELGTRLRQRKISPIALTEAYLERLQKLGPRLNAVVTVTRELALKEARAADDEIRAGKIRGPLHGVPYGVKDLAATRGIPTTWGAEPYRKQVFDFDATIVRKLRDAGAILVAKLAMVELAGCFGYSNADASFSGPCRNPWNTEYWAGGSSSGPGAAVAAGLVPFAIGSETSGSIITPAAYSGVSGLRPTYGRVSRHGAMALSWTLDKLGPMCRTAEDCGLVLAAIAGRDRLDPTSVARPFTFPEEKKGKFRIGIIKNATQGIQPQVRENFEQSLKVLAKFADISEAVAFPSMPFGPVVGTIVNAEGASAFRDLIERGGMQELRNTQLRHAGYTASTVLAVDYLQAMRVRTKMKRTLDELYTKFDALVAPSRGTVAYPIDQDFSRAYAQFRGGPPIIPAGNIAGQPAVSVPNGFGPNNLPTGIQFTGRAWSESRLLAIAHAYQQATDWHTRRPKLRAE